MAKKAAKKKTAAKKKSAAKAPAKKTSARKTTTYKSAADVPAKVVAEIKRLRKEGKTWLEVRNATGVRRPIAREALGEEAYSRPASGGHTNADAETKTTKRKGGKKKGSKKTAAKGKKGKGARKGTRSSRTTEASAESGATEKKTRKGRKRSGRVKVKSMDESWFDDDTDTEEVIEELEGSSIRYVTPEQEVKTIGKAVKVKELRNSDLYGRVFSMTDARTQRMVAIPMKFIIEVKDAA